MSAAVSSAALAIAVQAEDEAHKARCANALSQFDRKTATVAQAHEYADCVNFTYPSAYSPAEVLALKIAIVFALLSTFAGTCLGWRNHDDPIYGFLMGLTTGICVPFFLFVLCAAVSFLLA